MTASRTPRVRATMAQARMELKLLLRSGESLLVTLGIPLGILVFFSMVDVLPTGERDPVQFLVPGVLAISVMSTAFVALAIQTAFERKYGVLKRLGGTPLPRSAFLAAKAIAVVALLAVQTALVLAVAVLALDWSAAVTPSGVVLVLAGMLLGAFAFSALALLMAGTLRAELTLAAANALYLLLLLVSGVAIELDALPAPLAMVAVATPSGALAQVLRDALSPTDVVLWPLGLQVLLAWGALAAVAAVRTFRWEP